MKENSNQIIPINQAEAIFYPAFDRYLCDDSMITVENAETERLWDSLGICGTGTFKLHYTGKISLENYDKLICFISVPPHMTVEGSAVIDGQRIEAFPMQYGDEAPLELTGTVTDPQKGQVCLEEITLSFSGGAKQSIVLLSWFGLSASWRESLIENEVQLLRAEVKQWQKHLAQGEAGTIKNNLLFTSEVAESMKQRILGKDIIIQKIRENAVKAAQINPENCIREFVPVAKHMYRFVRVRDRGRESPEYHILNLAIAGWLFQEAEYSHLAARMILALLPMKWFEGPVCCMEGSEFHHVCFTEDHLVSEVCIAMGFLGGIFSQQWEQKIAEKVRKEWILVFKKCREKGYRDYMNQGIVGNRGALLGACYLKRFYPECEPMIQEAYSRHTQNVNNYLSQQGHCVEGGNYFEYSFTTSILLWHVYAKEQGVSVEQVVPERFIKASKYQEAIISTITKKGEKIPINCSNGKAAAPLLLLFLQQVCHYSEALGYVNWQLQDRAGDCEAPSFDLLFLEYYQNTGNKKCRQHEKIKEILFREEGMASFRFQGGKLLVLAEQNPYTAHYHEDRGSIVLEAEGEILLPDLGTTSYANPICLLMEKKEYHNLAYPTDLPMQAASRTGILAARNAAYPMEQELTKEDMWIPAAKLEQAEQIKETYIFRMETGMLYGDHITGTREGMLMWQEQRLILQDTWKMPDRHPLSINFLSYDPWQIEGIQAGTGKMRLLVNSEVPFVLQQEEGMTDWKGVPVFILRIEAEASVSHRVSTDITWQQSN